MYTQSDIYSFFIKALKNLIDAKILSQKSLAIEIGVSDSYVSQILTGKRMAAEDKQELIAKAFKFSLRDFIEFGRRLQMDIASHEIAEPETRPLHVIVSSSEDKALIESTEENYRGIPLYKSGRLAAGSNGVYFIDSEVPESEVIVYRPELKRRAHHKLVAVRAGGDSMEPSIPKNSIVVVDIDDREFVNRKVFCVNIPEGGQWMAAVKRIQEWEKGLLLISDNPLKNPPIPAELDWNYLCVGRIICMWRNAEEI